MASVSTKRVGPLLFTYKVEPGSSRPICHLAHERHPYGLLIHEAKGTPNAFDLLVQMTHRADLMPVALKELKRVALREHSKPPDIIETLFEFRFGNLRLKFVVDTVRSLTAHPKAVGRWISTVRLHHSQYPLSDRD
jgi:hypothetical protein